MKKMKLYNSIIRVGLAFIMIISVGCELDSRIDDLTSGFEGTFIDKNTNEAIYTEYNGAKLRLLDLGYGDVAQPLDYFVSPDGTFKNTEIYPATYKIWADGPFLKLDTIQSLSLMSLKNFNLQVIPNVTITLKSVELLYGIGMQAIYSYKVNDKSSKKQQIGLVYSDLEYPGFRNSAFAGVDNSVSAIKYLHKDVTKLEGTFTDTIYLKPNKKYYVRAMGHSQKAGDYWNYSNQATFYTLDVDVKALSVKVVVGAVSHTSAIIDVPLPPLEGLNIKIEYTDKNGNNISDIFPAGNFAYAANLKENGTTNVSVSLERGGVSGNSTKVAIVTDKLEDRYLENNCTREAHIPICYDLDMRYSLSKWCMELQQGPITDVSVIKYWEWYSAWSCTWMKGSLKWLPTNKLFAEETELLIQGKIANLLDLLPFSTLKKLTIEVGGPLFSTGETVSKNLNLKPLAKLPSLTTVVIGAGVPLTEADFIAAGLKNLTIIKN